MEILPALSAPGVLKVWGRRVPCVVGHQPAYVQAVRRWMVVFVEVRRVVASPEVVRRWAACLRAVHRWVARLLLLRHRRHD